MNHSLMRNQGYSILYCVGIILLASCGGESEQKAAPPPPIQSIIFMDKSTSVTKDPDYVNRKYGKALQDIVNGNIRGKGDRMDIYYIHENTSKAQAFSGASQAAVLEDTANASPTDREAIRNDFELALRKEKSDFLNQALAQLVRGNPTVTNQNTDIWASLEVINRIADTAATIKAYYFSDMVESMPGANRRDFHVNPPNGREQATQWAEQDASIVKKMIDPMVARKVQVYLVLPFKPTSSTQENNPNVTYYWEQLFKAAGVTRPINEIN